MSNVHTNIHVVQLERCKEHLGQMELQVIAAEAEVSVCVCVHGDLYLIP